MVAMADNAIGNLFDNASVNGNAGIPISTIVHGLPQASALGARLGNTRLKSMGDGATLNEANFAQRVLKTSSGSAAASDIYSANGVGNFDLQVVSDRIPNTTRISPTATVDPVGAPVAGLGIPVVNKVLTPVTMPPST